MQLTDAQIEIVQGFQIHHFGELREDEPYELAYFHGKTRDERIAETFEYLSQKSLLLQRINKILIFAGAAGIGIGWFLSSWAVVGIVVASFIALNFAYGFYHSKDIRNHTGWEDEMVRHALALITSPLWQSDLKR